MTRTFRVYRPIGLERDRPVPLVLVLHGGFGSGEQAERAYGWNATADAHDFVVCYPDGLMRAWNAGTCCGEPMRRGFDDVGFLAALIDQVQSSEAVDPGRIFVAGMSNGAMMAYRLAAELRGRLAAIGPVAGTMTVGLEPGTRPVSVCHIHGLADQHVPFGGGVGRRALGKDWRRPVETVIGEWRAAAGCGAPSVWRDGPVRIESAKSESGGVEVALVTVAGAGHQWPGSVAPAPRIQKALGLDAPSVAMDATAMLWSFFASHPAPGDRG